MVRGMAGSLLGRPAQRGCGAANIGILYMVCVEHTIDSCTTVPNYHRIVTHLPSNHSTSAPKAADWTNTQDCSHGRFFATDSGKQKTRTQTPTFVVNQERDVVQQ